MKHHLNTLFVFTQDAYLSKVGESVAVRVEREVKLRVPIHTLGGIVCFGRVGASNTAGPTTQSVRLPSSARCSWESSPTVDPCSFAPLASHPPLKR